MKAKTSDPRNSRLMSELLTLSKFENHVTELKLVRCRNSRCMSELPTVGTPDPQGFEKLAVGLWSSIPDTSGMNTGHVRYDLDSELSKLFKLRVVGTPDHCRNFRPSELPTYVGTPDEPTRGQRFYSCWTNTGHVRYQYRLVLLDQQENS